MKAGDIVKVRAYGGEILVRRVAWDPEDWQKPTAVVICEEEEWQAAQREQRRPEQVLGWPIDSVVGYG